MVIWPVGHHPVRAMPAIQVELEEDRREDNIGVRFSRGSRNSRLISAHRRPCRLLVAVSWGELLRKQGSCQGRGRGGVKEAFGGDSGRLQENGEQGNIIIASSLLSWFNSGKRYMLLMLKWGKKDV